MVDVLINRQKRETNCPRLLADQTISWLSSLRCSAMMPPWIFGA